MTFDPSTTALVVTDPQNDFLSPDGVTWELVGANVTENRTVEHLEQLITGAKASGYKVFVSPPTTTQPTGHGSSAAVWRS